MNYTDILSKLPKAATQRTIEVSEVELIARATSMGKRGYVHNAKTLEALEAYLGGYGILLSGGIGIGKTFFFQTVEDRPIEILSFNRCHLFKYEQLGRFLEETIAKDIVLDDIGWDAELANNFGTKFETLQVVLDYRLTCSKARTHITTNLSNDELCNKYDAHLVDRIYQLCKCFAMPKCESKREAQPNEIYLRNKKYARTYK